MFSSFQKKSMRVDDSSGSESYDIVVAGATPGGIAAAVAAARLGRTVLLIEYHRHVGGMSASGLGKSDVQKRHLIGGLFREFAERVSQHYRERFGEDSHEFELCRDGYYFEPSVAEAVFGKMLDECSNVSVLTQHRVVRAELSQNKLTRIEIVDCSETRQEFRRSRDSESLGNFRNAKSFAKQVSGKALAAGSSVPEKPAASALPLRSFWCSAGVFIDATYEGDLLAAAGAEFRLGRESRDEFNEPHAGVVYFDYQNGKFLPRTTGERDSRLPAYTYRLCLTTDSTNAHVLTEPPSDYSRENYTGYFDDLANGRLSGPKHLKPGRGYHAAHFDTMFRALSVTEIPNHKTDVNINPRPLAFPFPEENAGYVEGDDVTRQRICERHRNLTLGLLWFLQNDDEISEPHRAIANRYHLPRDEFTDNGHFPFQLYVREARRLIGEYTLTEHDMTSHAAEHFAHADTIAIGEFPIDSFPCRKRQPGDTVVLEGYLGMLDSITRPYGIPYRIMIPKSIDGLIVSVAASTTHVAYSSIRMEPTWMALGQAAGTAAHLAVTHQTQPRTVAADMLRRQLAADGQVLDHVELSSLQTLAKDTQST